MALTYQTYRHLIESHRALAEGYGSLGRALYSNAATMNASDPIGTLAGLGDIEALLWQPLVAAFPDLERRTEILLGGQFRGQDWFASTGYFIGHFERPLFGLAASGRPQWLRYGWFDRVEGDHVVESFVIFDFARLMIDTGQWPLAPPLGASWSPAPAPQDGLVRTAGDPAGAAESLALVEAMIAGLMQYDRQSLASMGMRRFWTPQFQ